MKKSISILIIILSLNFNAFSFSKDSTKTPNFKHELGFHIGSTSGFGPAYRIWYKKIGLQVSALPLTRFHGKNSLNNYTNLTYGLSLNYLIKKNKYVDFYSFLSSSTRSEKLDNCYFETWLCYEYETNFKFIHSTNVGLGLGFDFKFLKVMKLSTQIGYGVYSIQSLTKGNIAGGISLLYQL